MRFKKVYNEMKKKRSLYKDLINIINDNVTMLQRQLKVTNAHISWNGQTITQKYNSVKTNLLNKITEQRVDKKYYTNKLQNLITDKGYYM